MGKLPALQFYPRDWKADLELQSCSLEARGLWIELMCVMHEASPYGYLAVNGSVPSDNQVSNLVSTSPIRFRRLKAELIEAGVARIDPGNGMIYSKRMREDAALREVRREAGRLGGNPDLLNQKVNPEVNHPPNQSLTPSSSSSSSSSDKENKKKGAKAKKDKPLPMYSDEFKEWYDSYPRKEDKVEASRNYEQLRQDGIPQEVLIDARDAYKREIIESGTDLTYIQKAKKFLNPELRPFMDWAEKKGWEE